MVHSKNNKNNPPYLSRVTLLLPKEGNHSSEILLIVNNIFFLLKVFRKALYT